jgi:hypothetical protein
VKQADAEMNIAAFEHGQSVDSDRLDHLHGDVRPVLRVVTQELWTCPGFVDG